MNELSHPWQRLAGVAITAMVAFFLDATSTTVIHSLVLPLTLAFSAWLMTRSLMAVSFAVFTLAAINTQLQAISWIPSLAYPSIAVIALIVCMAIVGRRFRDRIEETHQARWAQRQQRRQSHSDHTEVDH